MGQDGTVYFVAKFESVFPVVNMAVCHVHSPSEPCNTLFMVRMDGSVFAYAMESTVATSPPSSPSYALVSRGYLKAPAGVKLMQTFTWEQQYISIHCTC